MTFVTSTLRCCKEFISACCVLREQTDAANDERSEAEQALKKLKAELDRAKEQQPGRAEQRLVCMLSV